MNALFHLNIRKKLYISYVFFIVLMVSGGTLSFLNGQKNKSIVNSVLNETMPIVHHLFHIKTEIQLMSSSVGLYLLSKDKSHQDKYQQSYHRIIEMMMKVKVYFDQRIKS